MASGVDAWLLSHPLQINHFRLVVLATIGGHGASDIALAGQTMELYGSMFLFASIVPEVIMNIVFIIASIAHFANDVTVVGSIALHAVLVTTAVCASREIAVDALLAYMVIFHLPVHFINLYDQNEFHAMAVAAVVMMGMGAAALLCPEVFLASSPLSTGDDDTGEWFVSFTKIEQAVVCSHVLFEQLGRRCISIRSAPCQ